MKRRTFLAGVPALAVSHNLSWNNEAASFSCGSYNWHTFFKREGKVWGDDLAFDIAEFSKSGFKSIEYSFTNPDMVKKLVPILKQHQIKMPSIYANSILHVADQTEHSINAILELAKAARRYGTKIIVTNPNPIDWNKEAFKSDEQLKRQLEALNSLGASLRKLGIKLAYHTHSTEMLAGAKEIHHMLQNTSSENVGFCLDLHWIFRGSHNSELAVFDILKMYKDSIIELHVRQSENGVWTETFSPEGDIDYARVAAFLKANKMNPHIVLEQCVEKESSEEMNGINAHQKGLAALKSCFK